MNKPLGHKAYGSIPHLPNSRLGPGDYHCHEGQAVICTTKARDRHDRIIVTEKLDGSNVAIANIGGTIVPLTRSGFVADTSPYPMHHEFHKWALDRQWSIPTGWRISGEWMAVAHGTIYQQNDPLIGFDVFDAKNKRILHDEARAIFAENSIIGAHVLSDGPPVSVDDALAILGEKGFHGAQEQIEGAVWRVERRGVFDFLAKFVRHDKQDGKYLSSVTGKDPVQMISLP
jgi:hypothetical protein